MAIFNVAVLLLIALIPVFISIVWKLMNDGSGEKLRCESRHFILPGMTQCYPVLNCSQISEQIVEKEVIGKGAVKVVKRGVWRNHDVAVNTLANLEYREDFLHGLHMLQQLQSTVSITQLVGECEQHHVFITQFHPLGSADHLELIFKKDHLQMLNTLSVRFALCCDYVSILHALHSGADGARVMCDSNDVNKTLSQFLLRNDLSLILNDVDALPLVNKKGGQLVKCGHHELFGDFVAPEQLWPYDDQDFNDSEMAGYDEKVDIWKVPDICEAFLGHVQGSAKLRLQLLSIHLKCKSIDPSERPAASDLLEIYKSIYKKRQL